MRTFFQRGFRPAICLILFCLLVFTLMPSSAHAMPVFINELHYDNAGADVGESVELVGLTGTNLQGWRLWFYNGSNGQSYASLALSGVFADQQNGYGTLAFAFAGIQNGSPDGIALVDGTNQLQQFISYEGAFTALNGIAANVLSDDIGIAESPQTAAGMSLQLTGSVVDQFQWRTGVSSFGVINTGQQFPALKLVQGTVAVAPSWLLLAFGVVGLAVNGRKKRGRV
jgi:hypothetical protein